MDHRRGYRAQWWVSMPSAPRQGWAKRLLLQSVSSAVAQAANPGLGDLRGERQSARLELVGDRLGGCQHVRKGSLGRPRRDTDSVSEGQQGSAGEAVMPAEH